MAKSGAKAASKTRKLIPLDRDVVKTWAKEQQVEGPTAEKVLWLTRVIHAISNSSLARDFVLMGGSAIVFLYRDMYRFSTDLDLDFVGNRNLGRKGQREVAARMRQDSEVFQGIADDLSMRFKTREEAGPRFVQHEMIYRSLYRRTDTVELDVSYRYGHSPMGPVSRQWPIAVDSVAPSFFVQTLTPEEFYATKAIAMFDTKERERLDFPETSEIHLFTKRKIRHLFDVYLLAEETLNGSGCVDLELFRSLLVLFGMTRIKNFEYFRGNAIGAYTDKDIENELLSVVPRDLSVPTAEEMKWTVRRFLDLHVFTYGEREHRFMEDFRAGHFRPEDLFNDAKLGRRLRDTQYYKEILGRVAQLKRKKSTRRKTSVRKGTPK